MEILLCVGMITCVILLLYCFLGLVRNDVVYKIRTRFLRTDWDAYKRLPEYGGNAVQSKTLLPMDSEELGEVYSTN